MDHTPDAPKNAPVKVLVVDDAPLMRKAITGILSGQDDIEVVGMAANGYECLQRIRELQPDVVTLDIDMPVMNGITAVKNIMVRHQIPIVIISSLVHDGYFAFEALRLGVMDFVPKPSRVMGGDWEHEEQLIRMRVRMASTMHVHRMRRVRRLKREEGRVPRKPSPTADHVDVVVMGTTLAGPNTIMRIVTQLTPDFPAAIVAMQEIHPRILEPFCSCFNGISPLEVVSVTRECTLEAGRVYVASTFQRVYIAESSTEPGRLSLRMNGTVASPIDLVFGSAAEYLGNGVCGVLLTGVGTDGTVGLGKIKSRGGVTLVQQQESCVYPNLVQHAMEHSTVDAVVSTDRMADYLESWARRH